MNAFDLADIGSTYTKLTRIDADTGEVLSSARRPTDRQNVATALLDMLPHTTPDRLLVASSAAGGLKMVAIGLVPELTAKAAREAALGAGARLAECYSYKLTPQDVAAIADERPDIVLLAGGTDGGNEEIIVHNAEALAALPADIPVVIAGNRCVAHVCQDHLSGRPTCVADNVMPRVGELSVDAAREAIRGIFLERIVQAKGLAAIQERTAYEIMPTPAAVLAAVTCMAPCATGSVMVIDLGGATTDVYSVGGEAPNDPAVVLRGLPEPRVKRTVEGDLGLRLNALQVAELAPGDAGLAQWAGHCVENAARLPDQAEAELDLKLARLACARAADRHVGRIEEVYTPMGRRYVQTGKDLRDAALVVCTGGFCSARDDWQDALAGVLYDDHRADVLKPREPRLVRDARYTLCAFGLLSQVRPQQAGAWVRQELSL